MPQILVLELMAALLPLVLPGKAVLSCASGKFAMLRQAVQASPLSWAVRPLAPGSPLVACHEHRTVACHGCPSCGEQLTVRCPRMRTANRHLPLAQKVAAPRQARQELHCHRTAAARPLVWHGARLQARPSTGRAIHGAAGVPVRSRIAKHPIIGAPAMHFKATAAAPNPSFKRTATGVPASAA